VKRNTYVVSLCGGLGNQFFELANALAVTDKEILLEGKLGVPRLNKSGVPEILSFSLPKRTTLGAFQNPSKLLSRAANYLLRTRSLPRSFEKSLIFRIILTSLANVLFSFYFNRITMVAKSAGLGIAKVKKSRIQNFQIGYFQSHLTTSNLAVYEDMKEILIRDLSESAVEILNESQHKEILVIHIRLTDYLSETSFGTPNSSYYLQALSLAFELRSFSDVWIFSDDVEMAKMKVHFDLKVPVTWFSDSDLSTAETFTVMRQGHGYIIANSSFSWWAARLSLADHPLVVAPKPWFKNLDEPDNLIPPDWVRIDANYD
jgi:hypothetical protein